MIKCCGCHVLRTVYSKKIRTSSNSRLDNSEVPVNLQVLMCSWRRFCRLLEGYAAFVGARGEGVHLAEEGNRCIAVLMTRSQLFIFFRYTVCSARCMYNYSCYALKNREKA